MTERIPVVPRPAATILLLRDDPFEVLMVRRRAGTVFSSALVFPGGLVDPEDRSEAWLPHLLNHEALDEEARALRIAALRETYEEVGILIAAGVATSCPAPTPRCDAAGFRRIVAASGGRLDLAGLTRFGHWVTPATAAKRFDTHFFLARMPDAQDAACDGGETVALEWLRPIDALARANAGEGAVLFPTRMNLKRLADSADSAAAIAAAARRPVLRVEPRVVRLPDGVKVVIPEEAGYGVTEDFRPMEP
jgi:8-oxo-dGTP pyrophosphatase MutT (NUDIX family)